MFVCKQRLGKGCREILLGGFPDVGGNVEEFKRDGKGRRKKEKKDEQTTEKIGGRMKRVEGHLKRMFQLFPNKQFATNAFRIASNDDPAQSDLEV